MLKFKYKPVSIWLNTADLPIGVEVRIKPVPVNTSSDMRRTAIAVSKKSNTFYNVLCTDGYIAGYSNLRDEPLNCDILFAFYTRVQRMPT